MEKGSWVLFREKGWRLWHFPVPPTESDTEEWLVSTRRTWRLLRSFLLEPFSFSNSGQYERVSVQQTKVRFDYSTTTMTIKYKMNFFLGNKINKVWHTFECTKYVFFFCVLCIFLSIDGIQNIFGLLFHRLISAALVAWKFQRALLYVASVIQCLLFTRRAWPIILSYKYFSRSYM